MNKVNSSSMIRTKDMTKIGMLSVIGFVLMYFQLPLTIGVLAMTTLAMISNYFVVFPLYAKVMPMDAIIAMGSAITSKITGLFSMMIYSVLPFNLIKGFTTSAVMMLVYKKVSPIFKK